MQTLKVLLTFIVLGTSAATRTKDVARLQSLLKSRLHAAAAEKAEAGVASSLRGKDNDCDEKTDTHWCPTGNCDGSGDKDSDDFDTSFDCQCLKYNLGGTHESSASGDCGKDCPDSTCTIAPMLVYQTLTNVQVVPNTASFTETTNVNLFKKCSASCGEGTSSLDIEFSWDQTISQEINWDQSFTIGMEVGYETDFGVSTGSVTFYSESSWSSGGANTQEASFSVTATDSREHENNVVFGEVTAAVGDLTCDITGTFTSYFSDGSTTTEAWTGQFKGAGLYGNANAATNICYNYECPIAQSDLSDCTETCDIFPPVSNGGKSVAPKPVILEDMKLTIKPKK